MKHSESSPQRCSRSARKCPRRPRPRCDIWSTRSRHTPYRELPTPARFGPISGPGTGTMSIDIAGPASDGGLVISATEDWWYSVRPRQTHTCEVYPNGGLSCDYIPAPSASELVLLPLLARDYFSGVGGSSGWQQAYKLSFGGRLRRHGGEERFARHRIERCRAHRQRRVKRHAHSARSPLLQGGRDWNDRLRYEDVGPRDGAYGSPVGPDRQRFQFERRRLQTPQRLRRMSQRCTASAESDGFVLKQIFDCGAPSWIVLISFSNSNRFAGGILTPPPTRMQS